MTGRLVRAKGRIVFPEKTLKEKACDEPKRSVVKPDYLSQIPTGALVIPGTEFPAVQPHADDKFAGENQAGVSEPAK